MRASVLRTVFRGCSVCRRPARPRADEVTPDRLLNADKEPGNWLHHHKNFSATRFFHSQGYQPGHVKNLQVA